LIFPFIKPVIFYVFYEFHTFFSEEVPGTFRRQNDPINGGNSPPQAEISNEPNNGSQLYMILMNGLPETENPHPTIIDALDFPPAYPGSPQEEHPPTYEEAFTYDAIVR